ncbi:MAG: TetR family transcriptional regulator C-terminal domain-containing protein [Parvibaculum sp.]|nr:TetR family transcriptional regulator C-terminal domain-containing protein [Parvibaculum sp.]
MDMPARAPNRNESRSIVRRGRPVGDREAKRADLLKAVISVIAQEGYAGASLRKVAQRAGCTTGAVTYYFENKEAMVAAVIEHLFDQFDTLLDFADIKERFRRWLDMTGADADLWMAQFQLLAVARHEPTLAVIFQRRYTRYRRVLASNLAKGQSEGTIRDDISADLLADQLSAMGDGWMMMLPIEPDRFGPRRIQVLLDAVIALIAPPRRAARRPRG